MKKNFICPRCKGFLNVGNQIVLGAQKDRKTNGLVFFNPEIGNYITETNPGFSVKKGEIVDFFCPLCNKKLASDLHDNLARIIMVDEDQKSYEILFSKVSGEKSTYKVIGESIEAYGEHNSNYIDFLNLSSTK